MKRYNKKQYRFEKNRNLKRHKKIKHYANLRKHANYIKRNSRHKDTNDRLTEVLLNRRDFIRKYYKSNYDFKKKREIVDIENEYGLETETNWNNFIKKSQEIVDFDAGELIINLKKCTRIWPSAITVLCSMRQWLEILDGKKPSISSTDSEYPKVNSYLYHCGFNEYVNIGSKMRDTSHYDEEQIIKIKREKRKTDVEEREDEIVDLLNKHTNYSDDDVEEFNDVIITEIFANVTEHGITHYDRGWWILAQFHPTYKFISICIADNGIGIGNSLRTGPQYHELIERLGEDNIQDESKLIQLAIEENISGAIEASIKQRYGIISLERSYESGSRRGNGLSRIITLCKQLNIKFTILSNNGYYKLNSSQEDYFDTVPNRVFAGTMYHLLIPTKDELYDND